MSTVRDYMHKGLITCSPVSRLADIAALLRKHRIHAVVVSGRDSTPLGVISDTDLLAGEWLGADPKSLAIMMAITAGELMTKPVATIEDSASVAKAANELLRRHVSRLIVTAGSDAIGVLSVSDLLAAIPRAPIQREHVRDVMSWGYAACHPGTPIGEAARAMLERDSRSLIVIGRGGKLAGVVTGFDLIAALADEPPRGSVISDFMGSLLTISPDATLREAVDLMLTNEVHRLVVVDPDQADGHPMGLISTTDIVVEMSSGGSVWQS